MNRLVSSLFCAALLAGCGVGALEDEGAPVEAAQDELSTTRSAKASGLTVWIDRDVTAVNEGGGTAWVLHGRASRDLTRVFSFICDDALGGATLTDPRSFEIKFEWTDFEVALAPRVVYLAVTTATGGEYYATYGLAPRLTDFSGPTSIWVKSDLVPRTENGIRAWVGEFTTSKVPNAVAVYNDIDTDPEVRQLTPTRWEFVYPGTTQMLSQPMGGAPLFFRADFPKGPAQKSGRVVVSLSSLSLSTQAPY
ncbi:MAG TPA: hypothetical protein VGK67_36855 [Myxococcales bacterium]|jgi:hypothetical protein